MIKDYALLSLHNVRNRGIRSWLTMLGIFIGIAAVVALISMGNGLQNAVTGQFSTLDPDKLTITSVETGFGPPGASAIRKLNEDDKELIEEVNGIDVTVPRLVRVTEVEFNDISEFKYTTNIPQEQEQIEVMYDSLNVELEQGRLLTRNDRKKVVLGNDFTNDDFDKTIEIGDNLIIQGEKFEVVGILKKAASFQINSVVFLPEEDLKDILNIDDEFDLIVVQIEKTADLGKVASDIEDKLRDDRDQDPGEEDFSVQTPQQSLQTINTILTIINLVVGGIAAVSLLVGGIGIMNTMYTSVLERTREIGVMKAVGARNRDILLIFLIEASFLGLVGGIIGAFIGLGLAFLAAVIVGLIFPGLNFGVQISYPLLIAAIAFSFIIGAGSGVLPSLQASRLKPVEALRA